MDKGSEDSELLEKVIIFLIILVGLILIASQYTLFKVIEKSYLLYTSIALIFILIVLIIWALIKKPLHEKTHHGLHHGTASFEHQVAGHAAAEHVAKPFTLMEKVHYGLVAVVAFLILFNQVQISQTSTLIGFKNSPITKLTSKFSSTSEQLSLTGDPVKDAMSIIIPKGTPFYGEALGVSFDDPIKSLEVIAQLDPAYGRNKVQLSPEERERYIRIDTTPTITCEFCCGAKTAVTKDGRPTCGCKHSWAIRGLTAYLVKNYPDLSDDEIKKELMRWKGMFFPKQMIQRYVQQSQTGQFTPDIAALLLDVDDEKLKEIKTSVASKANSQESKDKQSTSADIQNLPSMVGGC